jgi:hypothetical protein
MSCEPINDLRAVESPYQKDDMHLEPQVTRRQGSVFSTSGRRVPVSDEVFGQITENGPNYRDVGPPISTRNISSQLTFVRRLVGWELLLSWSRRRLD